VEAYSHAGGLSLAKALLSSDGSSENPEPPGNLPWCICGKCRAMPFLKRMFVADINHA